MVNPLLRKKAATTNESDGHMVDPPKDYPVLDQEKYAGQNFPYRGTQAHGVEPTHAPVDVPEWDDEREGILYDEPIGEADPVPVRIITGYGRELRKWRTSSVLVSNTPVQLAGRADNRTRLRIQPTTLPETLAVEYELILFNAAIAALGSADSASYDASELNRLRVVIQSSGANVTLSLRGSVDGGATWHEIQSYAAGETGIQTAVAMPGTLVQLHAENAGPGSQGIEAGFLTESLSAQSGRVSNPGIYISHSPETTNEFFGMLWNSTLPLDLTSIDPVFAVADSDTDVHVVCLEEYVVEG